MYHASNRKTTNTIIAIMVIGIVAVVALSLFTGRYGATTRAGTAIMQVFSNQ